MTNVKRLTVIALCMASCMGVAAQNGTSTQIPGSSEQPADSLPAQWDLQACIDYALQQNITIRKNRLNAESAQVDVKTARAALFPSLSASVSQRVVNRPKSETNTIIDGDNITSSQSKTSYNGSYGIDANWTLYNGGKRLNTIKQQQLNNRIAELSVAQSENSIEESIAQTYVQILYAAEAVKVNESTLEVSQAECERGPPTSRSRKHSQKRPGTTGSAGEHRQVPAGDSTSHPARLQTTTETTPGTGRRIRNEPLHPHPRHEKTYWHPCPPKRMFTVLPSCSVRK